MCDLFSASNIVSGVIAAFLWGLLYISFYYFIYMPLINRCTFYGLSGTYKEENKFPSYDGEQKVFETIKIKRKNFLKGNILSIEVENKKWVGEIEMNKLFPKSGKGYYSHIGNEKQRPMWGFIDIIRKEKNTILVHRSYMFPEPIISNVSNGKTIIINRGRMETIGYVWKKINN